MYHDWDEYQEALARQRYRESHQVSRLLAAELSELSDMADSLRSLTGSLREQSEQQARQNARLQQRQHEITRIQNNLAAEQRQLQEALETLDASVSDDLRVLNTELQQLAEQSQQAQQNLERQLQASQQALEAQIMALQQEQIAHVAAQEAVATDQMSRARLRAEAADILSRDLQAARLEALDLLSDYQEIQHKQSAFAELRAEDSQTALALAIDLQESARRLQRESLRRESLMQSAREQMLDNCAFLQSQLADPALQRFFKRELQVFVDLLRQLQARAAAGYQLWRDYPMQEKEDQRLRELLYRQFYHMRGACEVLDTQQQQRRDKVRELVMEVLPRIYGPLSQPPTQTYLIPEDLKSPVRVHCQFGAAQIELQVSLNGELALDGYGHDSNLTCRQQGSQVFQALQAHFPAGTANSQPHYDSSNRQQAASTDLTIPASWETLNSALQAEQQRLQAGQ
jgi:myosin heavy subunit